MTDSLNDVLARLEFGGVNQAIVPTRFPSIDSAIRGGLRRGDLTVLGGDVGSGASALALAIALRCSTQALLLTGEMREERVFERALAMTARVSVEALQQNSLTEEERARVDLHVPTVREWCPAVDTVTFGGTDVVFSAHDRVPLSPLVIVDGVEALVTRDFDSSDALAGALLELKRFALERNVAVLALMHLPALDPTRSDQRPQLGDFGAKGAIGVHADLVLGLFRDDLYESELAVSGAAELLVLKQRDGARGYVDLYFTARELRFQDVLEG